MGCKVTGADPCLKVGAQLRLRNGPCPIMPYFVKGVPQGRAMRRSVIAPDLSFATIQGQMLGFSDAVCEGWETSLRSPRRMVASQAKDQGTAHIDVFLF